MIKKFAVLIVFTALSGCAVNYTFEGQKYDSKEKFQQAVESNALAVVSTITPLPIPLSQRKLIFAMPSESTIIDESVRRFVVLKGTQPIGPAAEILQNLSKSNYKNIKVYYDAVQKKAIYASTQFVDMQSMTGSFAASPDSDVLYMVEQSQGSNQWYYVSHKQGKQIFAYDRSSPTFEGKVQAFVDAVQAQAIRE